MSQDILSQNTGGRSSSLSAQNTQQNYWASDDVHRIALRRPTLYRTNIVPQAPRPAVFDNFEQGEEP